MVQTDPMTAKHTREDEVVELVLTWFRSGSERAEVVGRPDREVRADGLTVDALIRFGDPGVVWAGRKF